MALFNHVTYSLSELDLLMVRSIPPGGNWQNIPLSVPSKRLEGIRATGGRTTLYGRLVESKPSYTITTYFNRPGNGAYIHPTQDRVISAREAARLQSFPDKYVFKGSKTSFPKQIGNAVPPLLAYAIGKRLKEVDPTIKASVDLFAGAGGLTEGFKWAGIDAIAANDNLIPACETYAYNHPKTKLIVGDITESEVHDKLFKAIDSRSIDIVIGGPPCQGFSYAGKRLIDDPRNFLYKEFVKVVKEINPPYFLMENVEGIMTSNSGKTYKSIQEDFEALGYKIHGRKLYAAEYGVPQKRKRVIIIGSKRVNPKEFFPVKKITDEANYTTVSDAISNLPELKPGGGEDVLDITLSPDSVYQELLAGSLTPEDFVATLKIQHGHLEPELKGPRGLKNMPLVVDLEQVAG